MRVQIWFSEETLAEWLVDHTILDNQRSILEWKKLPESDVNNKTTFHAVPDHIKNILYLDAPDLIVEVNGDPIFSLEITTEAGTGHNAFQRFGRLMAALENQVPAFYVYPTGVFVRRQSSRNRWDYINPNIYKAMESAMQIHQVPALLFHYPTCSPQKPSECSDANHKGLIENLDYPGCPCTNEEIKSLFKVANEVFEYELNQESSSSDRELLLPSIKDWRDKMKTWEVERRNDMEAEPPYSPVTATYEIPTQSLLRYLQKFTSSDYRFQGNLLENRDKTIIYQARAKYRDDPYPGALAALDYLLARTGKTYEDRNKNLVMAFGTVQYDEENELLDIEPRTSKGSEVNIEQFMENINKVVDEFILDKDYTELKDHEIPRFYMQTRHGTSYTLTKAERMYSYFADAILFGDGAVWREG